MVASHSRRATVHRYAAQRFGRLPFLTHDDDQLIGGDGGIYDLVTVVDARRVVGADPLAPAVQHQPPVQLGFTTRQLRVADEQDVDRKSLLDQQAAQLGHAHAQTAGGA